MTCFRRSGQQMRARTTYLVSSQRSTIVRFANGLLVNSTDFNNIGGWKSNTLKGTNSHKKNKGRSMAKFAQSPTWEEYGVRIDFHNLRDVSNIVGSAQFETGISGAKQQHADAACTKVRFQPSRVFCSDPLQPPVHEVRRLRLEMSQDS